MKSKVIGSSYVYAPFTPDQVVQLHFYQHDRRVHPFTCPNNDSHPFIGGEERVLVPTVRGWICRFCSYTQNWAHPEMMSARRLGE